MRSTSIVILSLMMLGGCANPPGGPEIARQVVLQHVGGAVGTIGPFNRKDKKELESLSPQDRSTALALLDRGALGFLICSPETGAAPRNANGVLADLIKVDRIIFVQDGQIVGDFAAVK
jgi:hypothetical protein